MATATTAATTITMPRLGESVTEGTIGAWMKQVGDQVNRYDSLVEVETDKVQTEIPSPVSGVLVEILVEPTTTVPVGSALCRIEVADAGGLEATAEPSPAPAAGVRFDRRGSEIDLLRARSSPVVRRLAAEHRVDLAAVPGTGIEGRVTKQDILAYIEQGPAPDQSRDTTPKPAPDMTPDTDAVVPSSSAPAPVRADGPRPDQAPAVPAAATGEHLGPGRVPLQPGDEIVPLTPMRRQIAEHMVRSERTAPHVTTVIDVDMTGVVALRLAHRDEFRRREGVDLTAFPFALKAVTHALRVEPRLNAAWDQDRIIQRRAINLGIAVALDDGLIVPVITHADRLSITGLAHAVADLSRRARQGALTPDDIAGGTFTVNNPGTFGSVVSTPILVQPQAAIVSTEAIIKRPVVIDDMIAIRSMMNLSLSIDHRVLDGLTAARFLRRVKDWLEAVSPATSLT